MRSKKELEDLGRLIVALHQELKSVEVKLGSKVHDAKYAHLRTALHQAEETLKQRASEVLTHVHEPTPPPPPEARPAVLDDVLQTSRARMAPPPARRLRGQPGPTPAMALVAPGAVAAATARAARLEQPPLRDPREKRQLALPPIPAAERPRSTPTPTGITMSRTLLSSAPEPRRPETGSRSSSPAPARDDGGTFLTAVDDVGADVGPEDYRAAHLEILHGSVHATVEAELKTMVKRLERLCQKFNVPRMRIDLVHIRDCLKLPTVPVLVLLDCVLNHSEVLRYMKLPGFKFRGGNRRNEAAKYISASWRMVSRRREFKRLKKLNKSALLLQVYVRMTLLRNGLRRIVIEKHKERRKTFRTLQYELGADWKATRRRVEVHVASLGVKVSRRGVHGGWDPQTARVFRAAEENVDVVFVCPEALHSDVQEYIFSIFKARGVRIPEGRVTTVTPEVCKVCPQINLSAALLCSTRALRRVQRLVQHRNAVLVPAIPASAEVDLAATLGIPMLGPDPRTYAALGSKTALPGIARLARVAYPHTEVDIAPGEFYKRFATAVQTTRAQKWVLKIDDELGARGSLLVDLHDYWRHIMAVDHEGCAELLEYLMQRLKPNAPEKYPTSRAFLEEFRRVGGVIQQVPEEIVGCPSVHVLIEPDGHVEVLSTSEVQRAPLATFASNAHMSPHSAGGHAVVAAGLRVGRALAMKGVLGFATVDLVVHKSPDYDPRVAASGSKDLGAEPEILVADAPEDSRMFTTRSPEPEPSRGALMGGDAALQTQLGLARLDPLAAGSTATKEDLMVEPDAPAQALPHLASVVDIDLRLTDTAASLGMLQFVADCECRDGALASRRDGEPRFMVLAPVVAPRLHNASYSALFGHAKQHGVSFDLLSYLGTLFVEMDLHEGHVTVGCVATTLPHVVHAALHALATLEKAGRKPEVGPFAPPPVHGSYIAAAIAALRVVQRRVDKTRAILNRD